MYISSLADTDKEIIIDIVEIFFAAKKRFVDYVIFCRRYLIFYQYIKPKSSNILMLKMLIAK